ncbi:MAG: T9SS type A sorting domain-containing protein [Bacteroidales bacterium]
MKQFLITLAVLLLITAFSFGQDASYEPTEVREAEYFDETPPLRDMPVVIPGERDRSWKDHVIPNASLKGEIREMVRNNPYNGPDAAVQSARSVRQTLGPVYNFEGTGNVNGVYPPDTEGAAGPDHYFQMINLSFSIYDKTGNKLYGPVDNSTLWNGFIGPWTGTNDGDPVVLYDEIADRWVATQFAVNTSNGTYWELIAVSQTPDPLGEWYRYAFQFFAFNDYPKISVWPDAYYATFNMFGSYNRVGVAAFERDRMIAGDPGAQMVYFDLSAGTFGMLPADFDGTPPAAGTPGYFAHLRTFDNHNLEIYAFDVDWDNTGNASFDLVNTLSPATYNTSLNGIPQPNTTQTLDDLAIFLMYRLQYRNFGSHQSMVMNHTVNVSGRAGIRWYEMRKTGTDWTLYQQGTYAPDTDHRWMGSIAMNGNGDIAVGYSVSSASTYPSIRYTARRADDPLGQMTFDEIEIIEGQSSQTFINRWGDYSCMSVDPADDSTFWFTTEYMKASGWGTRIASFDLGPLLPPTVDAGVDTTICEDQLYPANGTVSGAQSVLWTSGGDGFFQDPDDLNTLYLRGNQDIANGSVTLYLTAQGYQAGIETVDSVIVGIHTLPVAYAGADTLLCIGESMLLENASAVDYDSLAWTTDGDGTFDNDTILMATYTPGADDISTGNVRLTLTAFAAFPCEGEAGADIYVIIDECTGLPENRMNVDLSIIPNPNTGTFDMVLESAGQNDLLIEMYTTQGQLIFTKKLGDFSGTYRNRYDMSRFEKGIYFLRVQNGSASQTRKVIIY